MAEPVLNPSLSPTLRRVREGAIDPAGITVSSLVVGGNITDVAGAAEAIAIAAIDIRFGLWQFSLNGGMGDAHTFRAWHQSDGAASGDYAVIAGAGAAAAYSSAIDTASVAVSGVNSAPGSATAGTGTGKAIIPVGDDADYGRSVTLQPDGKIVLAGYSFTGGKWHFSLIRLNPNGSLDTSFDDDGKAIIPVSDGGVDVAESITLQPDGKIVVAGYSVDTSSDNYTTDFSLIRLNPSGSLDISFDDDGKAIIPVSDGDLDFANRVTLQPDGKIVVAGYGTTGGGDPVFNLIRLNPNGSLDTELDVNVKANIPVYGSSFTQQPDGKIVVAGYSYIDGGWVFNLIRLNPNGSLDTSFGDDGKAIIPRDTAPDYASSVTLQPDGKILTAGSSDNGSGNADFSITRLNPNGSVDPHFGNNGKAIIPGSYSYDLGRCVNLQPDGKIVVAGYSYIDGERVFTLIRVNPNGSLDTSFDGDGKAIIPAGSHIEDPGRSVTLQPDGKILVAGSSNNGIGNADFSIIRLNPDGSVDTTFGATATTTRTAKEILGDEGYYQTFFTLSAASYWRIGGIPGIEKRVDDGSEAYKLKCTSHEIITAPDSGIKLFWSPGFESSYPALNVREGTHPLPTPLSLVGLDNYFVRFNSGYYVGYTEGLLDTASVALVGRCDDALFIAFRGTDTIGDGLEDALGMTRHYERYRPLIDTIDAYLIANPDVKKVYVSGHSLGGQMAMMYMQDHVGDSRYEAVTFEAANKFPGLSGPTSDERFTNFEMSGDPVPDLGLSINYGRTIHLDTEKIYEEGAGLLAILNQHFMFNVEGSFKRALDIIGRGRLELNPDIRDIRVYIDDNSDGVIVTPVFHWERVRPGESLKQLAEYIFENLEKVIFRFAIEKDAAWYFPQTSALLAALAKAGIGIGSTVATVVIAAIYVESVIEYWRTAYEFRTAFDGPDGILVLRPFVGISGGVYELSENVQTVVVGDDRFSLSENISVNASAASGTVVLIGNSASNVLTGGSGDDFLFGGADKDILIGGPGNDTLFGGLYRNSDVMLRGLSADPQEDAELQTKIAAQVQAYSDGNSGYVDPIDPVDVGFYSGGWGADRLIGELSDHAYGSGSDNDGDNDYFFIDVDTTLALADHRNVDCIENFYVAASDPTADDWIVFSAEQLGLSVTGDLEPYFRLDGLRFGLSGYTLDLESLFSPKEERFFKVSTISQYTGYNGSGNNDYLDDVDEWLLLPDDEADALFAFVFETSTGNLYFDRDGNRDFDDARLVANLSPHPRGDPLTDLHANQIIIVADFGFIETARTKSLSNGKLVDGYIAGASLYLDANHNGIAEPSEATGVETDDSGGFALLAPSDVPIIALGGTNIDTGLPNLLQLSAPGGSTVVSPLTTLIQQTSAQRAVSAAEAQEAVKAALGLNAEVDLAHFDPLAQEPGNADALAVQQVAAQVATLTTLAPEGGTAFAALAAGLGGEGEPPLDLSNAQTLQGLLPDADAEVLDRVAAVNQALGDTTSLEGVTSIQLAVANDASAPSVLSLLPADEAPSVAVTSHFVLTFDEAVQRGSGAIALKTAAGALVESFDAASSTRLSFSGPTLTINPTMDLAFNATYVVELAAASVQDLVGNAFAGLTDYGFSTASAPPPPSKLDNFVIVQYASPTILGSGPGNDTYLLSPSLLPPGMNLMLSDNQGADSIQLGPGLGIASCRVAADAMQFTLDNGSVITVLGASRFTYEAAGNATAGLDAADASYSQFAQLTLGLSVPSDNTLAIGGALVVGGGAALSALATSSKTDNFVAAEYASPAILGSGLGDDTYLLSPSLLPPGTTLTISDALGVNSIQVAAGLSIASSRVAATALQLTLANGSIITILGADAFGYEAWGNRSTGVDGADLSYAAFALQVLGVAVPSNGVSLGGAVEIGASPAAAVTAASAPPLLNHAPEASESLDVSGGACSDAGPVDFANESAVTTLTGVWTDEGAFLGDWLGSAG